MRTNLRFQVALPALIALLIFTARLPAAENAPPHLVNAELLLTHLPAAQTSYQHKQPVVSWPGTNGTVECHADCSGFINALLTHTYPRVNEDFFRRSLGQKRPQASDYHEAIERGKILHRVERVADARPGDIIAIKYPPGAETTGHLMLIAEAPRRRTASKPLVNGTEQWEVTIIDSSMSGHGPTDTRRKPDRTLHNGLGKGVLRLYADKAGGLAGYSWSTLGGSAFHEQTKRHAAIGRLDLR